MIRSGTTTVQSGLSSVESAQHVLCNKHLAWQDYSETQVMILNNIPVNFVYRAKFRLARASSTVQTQYSTNTDYTRQNVTARQMSDPLLVKFMCSVHRVISLNKLSFQLILNFYLFYEDIKPKECLKIVFLFHSCTDSSVLCV